MNRLARSLKGLSREGHSHCNLELTTSQESQLRYLNSTTRKEAEGCQHQTRLAYVPWLLVEKEVFLIAALYLYYVLFTKKDEIENKLMIYPAGWNWQCCG